MAKPLSETATAGMMEHRVSHFQGGIVAALMMVAAVLSGPTRAAPPEAAGTLEEIVVTAEKRASTVQETPISMTALSGQQIENEGLVSVEELAGAVPGISMRTAGPGQTEYEMRGLTSAGGSAPTVGFYLDETPLSPSAVALNGRTVIDPDLFDLNHVEVLRGPQGTLYGSGSMGGTIKLITNPPKLGALEGAASANTSYTDGGSLNGGGNLMLNFPIGEVAALRIVSTEKYISGWIDRVVIKQGDFPFPTNQSCGYYFCDRGNVAAAPVDDIVKGSNLERFFSTRATFLVKPNEALSVTTTAMYQRIDADGYNAYQSPPGNEAIYQPYDIQEPYFDQFKLASFVVTYDFGVAALTSSTAYWQRFVEQSQDSTEPLQNIFNLTTFMPTLYVETDPTTQISQELRLTSTGNGPFQWVGGLYAADLHSGYVTYQNAQAYANAVSCTLPYSGGHCPPAQTYNPNNGGPTANPNGAIFDDDNPNVMKQSAAFGELSYKLSDDLKLTAGVRYFKFQVSNHADQCGLGTGTGNGSCTVGRASGSGDNVLPKLNISYAPTADLNLYSTIAKGSRPGGVNLPIPLTSGLIYYCGPGSGPSYLTSQPSYYGPDSVWSFEVGEKSRFDDRRFTINADVYYIKWEDIQQIVPLSCGYPYDTNAGTARAYGPELEMSARVTDAITISASATYTNAEINHPTAQLVAAGFTPGTRILSVPNYTGVLSLNFERPLTNDLTAHARVAESYVGPIQDVAFYRETLPSYGLMDARGGIDRGALAMNLFVTNLTNKHAALTINNTTFAWQQPTITRVSTNQPRTVGVEATIKF
jgi:outer membrane receptor protein involved in Fe transport